MEYQYFTDKLSSTLTQISMGRFLDTAVLGQFKIKLSQSIWFQKSVQYQMSQLSDISDFF